MNLALKGWRWLRSEGKFQEESVEKIMSEFQYRANHVKRFLDDECIIDFTDPEYLTTTDKLYAAYTDYCTDERNRLRTLPLNSFGSSLAELGIIKTQKMKKGKRDTYYVGVRLKSDARAGSDKLVWNPVIVSSYRSHSKTR